MDTVYCLCTVTIVPVRQNHQLLWLSHSFWFSRLETVGVLDQSPQPIWTSYLAKKYHFELLSRVD